MRNILDSLQTHTVTYTQDTYDKKSQLEIESRRGRKLWFHCSVRYMYQDCANATTPLFCIFHSRQMMIHGRNIETQICSHLRNQSLGRIHVSHVVQKCNVISISSRIPSHAS
jgi:hypothetical protein